jgi:hypothetical protein
MNRQLAKQIFEILVETCGADWRDWPSFAHHVTTKNRVEFRFQGNLGFGGKFHRYGEKMYVSCYTEDDTFERRSAIQTANERIYDLTLGVLHK